MTSIIHVNHNHELFIALRVFNSQLRIVDVIYNLELCLASRALDSQPKVVDVK